jgi:hypothetical protein
MQHIDSMLQGVPSTCAEQNTAPVGDHGGRGSGDHVAARSSGSGGLPIDQTAAAVTSSDHKGAPLLVVWQKGLPERCLAAAHCERVMQQIPTGARPDRRSMSCRHSVITM